MLISLLLVGDVQEMNKPIHRLEDSLKPRLLHIGAAACIVLLIGRGNGLPASLSPGHNDYLITDQAAMAY